MVQGQGIPGLEESCHCLGFPWEQVLHGRCCVSGYQLSLLSGLTISASSFAHSSSQSQQILSVCWVPLFVMCFADSSMPYSE